MKLDHYLEERQSLRASNRLLKFAIVVIGLAVLVQSFFTYLALNHQKVVLVPPGLSEKVWVRGNEASDEYLRHMAKYLALLLLHFTPASVEQQFAEFLTYAAPEAYPSLKVDLLEVSQRVKDMGITSVFHVQEVVFDPKKRTLEVKGHLAQYAGDAKSLDQYIVLRLGFYLREGRIWINEVEQTDLRGS